MNKSSQWITLHKFHNDIQQQEKYESMYFTHIYTQCNSDNDNINSHKKMY